MKEYLFRALILIVGFSIGIAVVATVTTLNTRFFKQVNVVSSRDLKAPLVFDVDSNEATTPSLSCVEKPINIALVRKMLDSGVNTDSTNESCIRIEPSPRGVTLLMEAAYGRDIDVPQLLLDSGANINQQDDYGDTPLSYAVRGGNLGMVRFLLEKGADVDLGGDQEGETPLMIAASDGDIDMIDCLLDHGAKINARDANRTTALMFAAGFNQHRAFSELLSRGANGRLKDKGGRTAVNYAKRGFPEGYLLMRE